MVRNTRTPPPMPSPSPEPPRARGQREDTAEHSSLSAIEGTVLVSNVHTENIRGESGKIVGQVTYMELLVQATSASYVVRFYGDAKDIVAQDRVEVTRYSPPTEEGVVNANAIERLDKNDGHIIRTYFCD